MPRQMVGIHNSNWHMMLFSTLWVYQTSVKSSTRFTPFHLVYGIEAIFPIECQIPSLKIAIETKSINKDLNCKRREFILTWSRRMVVSSTVAPEITTFIKGFFLLQSQFPNQQW
jgi:hypothetical protein